MFTLILVFKTEYESSLRELVAKLITDGGAIDTPIVSRKDGLVELSVQFGPMTDTRLVSRFTQAWVEDNRNQAMEFIGLRDAA